MWSPEMQMYGASKEARDDAVRNSFWPCFIEMFSRGDPKAIETLLFHEIVDVKQEMSQVHLKISFWVRFLSF